jgi:CheY-like chemotaxis protein
LRGYIVITRDRTQQRQAQEALLEARNAAEAANIAKTEFLANMSHEIRTPMNAIIGLSAILAHSAPLTERQQDFIRTLQTSADALMALINDLLDIAKIEARSVELERIPFSFARLVQEVVSMMSVAARDKGLRFSGETPAIGSRLHLGDPTRLRQVVANLCSNAIKFTDTGFVRLTVEAQPAGDGLDSIVVRVADSGIGIEADKIDGIFNKFVQADTSINRKYGGTGLGLAITKTLTELMGGTISVDSRPGEGTVFEVRLPLPVATAEMPGFDAAPLARLVMGDEVRPIVLLVEDHEPNILVAGAFLDEFGYRFDIARNGLEAFEKIKENSYTAVLMDVQMHGMNGLDATRAIRQWEAQTGAAPRRIVGMTAHALAGDRELCLGVGMDDYIAKPFHPEDLRRKLQGA